MTSKLEEAAKAYCQKEKDLTVTLRYDGEGAPKHETASIKPNSRSVDAFKAGARWTVSEAKSVNGFEVGTMTVFNAVSIEYLEKLIGEE